MRSVLNTQSVRPLSLRAAMERHRLRRPAISSTPVARFPRRLLELGDADGGLVHLGQLRVYQDALVGDGECILAADVHGARVGGWLTSDGGVRVEVEVGVEWGGG